jgi:hypothetical protein
MVVLQKSKWNNLFFQSKSLISGIEL